MEGGEDEVTGFGRLESGGSGEGIPDLAEHDDIRSLAKGAAQSLGKGRGIGADLALGKVGEAVGEKVFDGILDGDDMEGEVLVQPFEAGGHGGGLTGAGGPGDQNQAGGALEPLLKEFHGQAEILHGGNACFDATEDGTAEAELAVQVDAEADAILGDVAGVVILLFWAGAAASPKIFHPGRFKRGNLHGANDLAEADVRHRIFAQEEVGGAEFAAGPAEILDVVHRLDDGRNRKLGKSAFPNKNDLNDRRIIS